MKNTLKSLALLVLIFASAFVPFYIPQWMAIGKDMGMAQYAIIQGIFGGYIIMAPLAFIGFIYLVRAIVHRRKNLEDSSNTLLTKGLWFVIAGYILDVILCAVLTVFFTS